MHKIISIKYPKYIAYEFYQWLVKNGYKDTAEGLKGFLK